LTNQVIGEVRTVSHLLHPPLLDEAGLSLALQSFVDGLEERSDIAVSMDVAPTFSRASMELETVVFRTVQECLTNVHRHSGSKIATIALSEQEGVVRLEVRDEGCGIPGEVFGDQGGAKSNWAWA
jgi:two-component system NarL family sensor kinase